MKNFKGKLTSSLLLSFALLSNACGTDELKNKATKSSTLSSANAISSITKAEKREMANEFFQTVVSLAEESNMIDVWKMAIDKNLENPNRNLVEYINDEGDFDFQPVFAGRITLVKTKLVSLLRSEQEVVGLYTDTELSVEELIQQMLRRTIPVIGKPVHKHVFDEESPLAGYKLTAYPSENLGLGGLILIWQLPYSANAFKIDLEKVK